MRLNIFYLLILTLISLTSVFAQDIKGSKDHPLISRYPGSSIEYYEDQKFLTYDIATGPETGYKKIDAWVKAEGKYTRIYYSVKGETTLTEVYRNYQTALKKGGFEILAQGIDESNKEVKKVGGRTFLGTAYTKNPLPNSAKIKLLQGSSTSGGGCYIASKFKKDNTVYFIVIGGSQYAKDEKVFLVDIIEQTAMEDDLIKVNADEMLKSIESTGKVAIYDIYFDFDKSEIKPESKATIEEIAKLLQKNTSLKLYIVGHTDMKGTLEYNMALSKKRAEAVVEALIKGYNISSTRLSAQGVGPLTPVSTNKTEDGKKLNRRVELVQM